MKSLKTGKLNFEEKGLKYILYVIESLVFALPFFTISYIFYCSPVTLKSSQLAIIALTLVLILCGLIILRQIFDKFLILLTSISKAASDGNCLKEIQRDKTELKEVSYSFKSLIERFEETTTELRRTIFELYTIKKLTDIASKTLDIDELLSILVENAMGVTNAQIGSVFMVENKKQQFRVVASRGLESRPEKDTYINVNESLARFVVSDKKPLVVQDVETDPRINKPNDPKYGTPSFLSMPIIIRENLIAVLNLAHKETKQAFDSNDTNILSIMIGEIGFALENAQLHSKVEEQLKILQKCTTELTNANDQLKQEITERKRTEEVLEREKEKFRILVEESPLGVSIIGEDGQYKYTNPEFTKIFGYAVRDIPTGREWFKRAFPDREYRNQVISTWIKDQKASKVRENNPRNFTVTCKDGSEKVIYFKSVRMKFGGQFVIYEDITEKEKLEDRLRRAEKMEVVGTLAGGVAHDLNNVLSGIVSYPELLLMDLSKDSPYRKPIESILESGKKAAAIVQDLLTLARRGVTATEVASLNTIISEYLKSPEHEKLKSFHPKVQVETNLKQNLLNVLGSSLHLSKTVMNLVSNAAEAMPDGGKVLIFTENRYIDKPISGYDDVEEGDYVVLKVCDTGVGITPKDRKRIFEPFYTKKVMGRSGTGLGMAVVWGTVRDHKGYIDIQSAEGKGTKFILYFPASRKELTKDTHLLSYDECIGKGESILVVDDVKEQREIAFKILSELGYTVATISSGEEAIEYLRSEFTDLLVLDMIMDPGLDGLDTYRRILELHPTQKAIITSGFSETDRVKEAQKLGAGQYIKKPYTLESIGVAVRKELDK